MNLLIVYQMFLLILSTMFWVGFGVKLHSQSHPLNDPLNDNKPFLDFALKYGTCKNSESVYKKLTF